jgi:predicted ATP-binding protein involved in virulence
LAILYILDQAYGDNRTIADTAIADMICISVFFLLRPGESTDTTANDTPFRLEDVGVYICDRKLDNAFASDIELDSATSVSYTFTTQKNGTCDKKLVQGRSGYALCCPVRATIRRVRHHRLQKSGQHVPIASYYATSRRTAVKPKDVTHTLRTAMRLNFHRTGINASDISARSLRASGVMAMFHGDIDMNSIRLMGRWNSDAMMRYLHG